MKRKLIIYWLPVVLWMGFIFFLSSFSNPYKALLPAFMQRHNNIVAVSPHVRLSNEHFGDVSHVSVYVVLGFLLMRAYRQRPMPQALWLAWVIAILYSLSDETHQLFVPRRTFQLIDLTLDAIGSFTGIWLYKLLIVCRVKTHPQEMLK
jgi:VanZ family protein